MDTNVLQVYGDLKSEFFTEITLKNIFFPLLDQLITQKEIQNTNIQIQNIFNNNDILTIITDANAILNQQSELYWLGFLKDICNADNQSSQYNMVKANLQFIEDYSSLKQSINAINTTTQKLNANIQNQVYNPNLSQSFNLFRANNNDYDYLTGLNFTSNPDFWTNFNQSEIQYLSKYISSGIFINQSNYFDAWVVNLLDFISSIDLDNRWYFGLDNYISYQDLNENCLYFKVYAYTINTITNWIALSNQLPLQWKEQNHESLKGMFLSISLFQNIINSKLINYYQPLWLNNSQGLINGATSLNELIARYTAIYTNAVNNDNINTYIDISPELEAIKQDFQSLDFTTPNSFIIEDILYISTLQNKTEKISKTSISFLANLYGTTVLENIEPLYDFSQISQNAYLAQNLINPQNYTYNAALGVWLLNYKTNPIYGYDTPSGQSDYGDMVKDITLVNQEVEQAIEYFLTKISCFINNFNCILNLIVSIFDTINDVINYIDNLVDEITNTFDSVQNEFIGLWNDLVVGNIMGQQGSITNTISGLLSDPTAALNCVFNTVFSQVLLTVNNFPSQITSEMQDFINNIDNQLPNDIFQLNGCKIAFKPPKLPGFNLDIDLGSIKIPDIINGTIDINVDMDCTNGSDIDVKYRQIT